MNVNALVSISVLLTPVELSTYVFVDKSRVGSLPSCDTSTAITQSHETRLNPSGAEAIEKVGLAGDLILVEVRITQLANVYLVIVLALHQQQ